MLITGLHVNGREFYRSKNIIVISNAIHKITNWMFRIFNCIFIQDTWYVESRNTTPMLYKTHTVTIKVHLFLQHKSLSQVYIHKGHFNYFNLFIYSIPHQLWECIKSTSSGPKHFQIPWKEEKKNIDKQFTIHSGKYNVSCKAWLWTIQ